MNSPSPFWQSLWQHLRYMYVAIQTSRRPRQTSRINSPPRSIFIKLDLGISPPLLNRFSRFQRRCNLLIHTFPTVYNMTQYSEGFSEEEQVNKNTAIASSHPQSRYRNVNNTVRITRIN